jgi:hypothetical protein
MCLIESSSLVPAPPTIIPALAIPTLPLALTILQVTVKSLPPPSAGLQTPPSDPHTYPPPQNTAAAIPSENLITEEAAEVEAHRASLEQKSRFPGCLPKVLPYLCGWDGER